MKWRASAQMQETSDGRIEIAVSLYVVNPLGQLPSVYVNGERVWLFLDARDENQHAIEFRGRDHAIAVARHILSELGADETADAEPVAVGAEGGTG